MGAVVALDSLFNGGRVWKGRPAAPPASVHPTGLAALDAVLPSGGWPEAALSEILMAKDSVDEKIWGALHDKRAISEVALESLK